MIKNIFRKIYLFVTLAIFLPTITHAQNFAAGIIPCDGTTASPCDFKALITLGQNIINYLIEISVLLAVIASIYVGFQLLIAGGDESKIKDAKEVGRKVLIGFLWVLGAWVFVYTILQAVVSPEFYNMLIKP